MGSIATHSCGSMNVERETINATCSMAPKWLLPQQQCVACQSVLFGLCRYPSPEPMAENALDVEHGESSYPNKEEKTLVPNLRNVVTCQKT
jgi:hypothetical protein